MYTVALRSRLHRRELFVLPGFALPGDARMFCRGFQFGLSEDGESASEDELPMYRRGAQFAFVWQTYARTWGLDDKPLAVIEGGP